MNKLIPSPAVRAWIYGVLIAAGPLAVFYGLATEQEVALWLGVASAALGNSLALLNTPTASSGGPTPPTTQGRHRTSL